MKNLILIISFLYTLPLFANLIPGSNSTLKPMMRIGVSAIDTSGKLETFMSYDDEMLEQLIQGKMDSLLNTWYVRNAFQLDSITDTSLENLFIQTDIENMTIESKTVLPDSIYLQRLQDLGFLIDMSFNSTVKNVIANYTIRNRKQMETMLGLSKYYFPMFEEILDRYEMPLELKYMAVVESALNPRAFSRAGACGLWQFVLGTGKMYGLEINSFVDERRDPEKATEAAARYLKDLYNIYGNWHLAIAAYNCGPGNVNKAIRRSGGKRDYWSIYYHLPRETRGYVPLYIGASYAMNYYEEHKLTPKLPSFDMITDTIMVYDYLHFEQVVKQLDVDIEMLRDLNPMYRRDIIPATIQKPYPLCLPIEKIGNYIDYETDILAYEREKYFPNNQIKDPKNTAYSYVPVDVKGKDIVHYKVKSGDNIGYISDWFHVRASDLRYWNNIRGNLIRVGQRMVVYVPSGKGDYYSKFDAMSFADKQKTIGKTATASTNTTKTLALIDANYEYYTVRSGDNLWDIAKNYPGVSAENIKQLNGISDHRKINIGQKIKIRKK